MWAVLPKEGSWDVRSIQKGVCESRERELVCKGWSREKGGGTTSR